MPPQTVHLKLTPRALAMLDKIRGQEPRDRWVFGQIRENGAQNSLIWNAVHAQGQHTLPNGVEIKLEDIPGETFPFGDGPSEWNLEVLLPPVVAERMVRATLVNSALIKRLTEGKTPQPWPTVQDYLATVVPQMLVAAMTAFEGQQEQEETALFERDQRIEAERARRRAQLEGSAVLEPGSTASPPVEEPPAPEGAELVSSTGGSSGIGT
jgi:hypothetical protein